MREVEIQNAIRKRLDKDPGVMLWRLAQGAGRVVPVQALRRLMHLAQSGANRVGLVNACEALLSSTSYATFGMPAGAADLIGLCDGRFFALEVKRKRGKQSEAQTLWMQLVREYGGFYAVVRSEEDALAAVKRCREGCDG